MRMRYAFTLLCIQQKRIDWSTCLNGTKGFDLGIAPLRSLPNYEGMYHLGMTEQMMQ